MTDMPQAILVTGAARRVGALVARRLAERGTAVVLHANTRLDEAEALAGSLRANGGEVVAVAADLADRRAVAGLMDKARAALGRPLTGLVNNASTFENDEAHDFTPQSWDRHMEVNLHAPCVLARDLHAQLAQSSHGAVVNLLDQRVFKPTPLFFTYALSKAGLHAATTTLAQALAPRVRVNAVAPGPTLRNTRQNEADFAKQVNATPLQTGSPPDAVADAVLWLLDAGHVTGQTLAVDGGQSLIWQTPDVVGIVE
jgi:NAD(P)-dependent dehydrogenase (short-subunit alcohol dehydrogenase family)